MQTQLSNFPSAVQDSLSANGETSQEVTLELIISSDNSSTASLECGSNSYPLTGITRFGYNRKPDGSFDYLDFVTSSTDTYTNLKAFGKDVHVFLMG